MTRNPLEVNPTSGEPQNNRFRTWLSATLAAAIGAIPPPDLGTPFASAVMSGRWSVVTYVGSISSNALVAGDLLLIPFIPAKAGTITDLGVPVTTTGAGSTIKLALYASDANGRPSTKLGEIGTPIDSASSTGWKKAALSAPVAVTARNLYWFGIVAQGGTPTVRSAGVSMTPLVTTDDGDRASFQGYRQASVTGSLPSPYTPSDTYADRTPLVRALFA